jgi:hypothetical protein
MVRTTISNAMRTVDLFGYKIVLNYRHDNEYKSKIGGLTSITLMILIFLYAFTSLIQFFGKTLVFSSISL